MADFLVWLGTHPFERSELNVLFWLGVVALTLIWVVLWWGRKGSGRIKG